MKMVTYTELAQITANKSLSVPDRLEVCLAGLAGELGEIFELLKKHKGHGHDLDTTKLIKECGDFLWYVAEAATHLQHVLTTYPPDPHPQKARPYTLLWRVHKQVSIFSSCFACTMDFDNTPVSANGIERDRAINHLELMFRWFCEFMHNSGLDIEVVMRTNIDKLAERYPDGFSAYRSLNRKANDD